MLNLTIFIGLMGKMKEAGAIGDTLVYMADVEDMLMVVGTRAGDVLR